MAEIIDLLDRRHPISLMLFEALAKDRLEVQKVVDNKIPQVYRGRSFDVSVECTINGVPVDLVEALNAYLVRINAHYNDLATKRAVEIVTETGLNDLYETLQSMKWQVEDRIRAAGFEIPDDEDY